MGIKESRVVPLAEILVGDYEVRVAEADAELEGLAESIRRDGLLQPLGVYETERGLVLAFGHRRYSACVMARLARVPVNIMEGDARTMERASIVENYHRKDVSPMERAAQIGHVLETEAMTLEELAKVFDRTPDWVRQQAGMLAWPADVQELVHGRQLTPTAAKHLAQIGDDEYREFLLRMAVDNGCSERTAIAWLQGWRAMLPVEQVAAEPVQDDRGPMRPVVPRVLCLGCQESYPPDGLCMTWICPTCLGILQAGGSVNQGRPHVDRSDCRSPSPQS